MKCVAGTRNGPAVPSQSQEPGCSVGAEPWALRAMLSLVRPGAPWCVQSLV